MANILTLPPNTKGRDFVVGDIHGAYELLEQALAAAKFDTERDRLISVGDLVDRGPQSPRALEFLKKPWFHAVRGNHEDMFLDIVHADGSYDENMLYANIRNGFHWILEQTPETLAIIRAEFARLPIAIETTTERGTVGFLHAEIPAGMDWQTFKDKINAGDEKLVQEALWSRTRITKSDATGVAGIDRIFSGHTPQESGPTRLGNCYYVDTGAVFRVIKGHEEYIMTLSDIQAATAVIPGPAKENESMKVVTEVPKGKKFGNYGPKP